MRAEPARSGSADPRPQAARSGPPRGRLRALAREVLPPLVAYTAAAVWFTWPLARVGADHVITSWSVLLNDLYLILWILSWVGRALVTDPSTLFDGNALHPTPHAIAASEHLLGDMPLFLPVWLATDNAILALNATTFASFVLAALAAHLVAQRWTGSRAAGWVAGVAFAFAPWRADLGRPHLLQVQYLPLVAYGLDRVVATGRIRTALLTAAALAVQVLCSYYLGYAAYLMAGCFVAAWLASGGWRELRAVWRALAVALVAPLVVVVPVSVPYLLARAAGGLDPDLGVPLETAGPGFLLPLYTLATYAGWGTVTIATCALVPLARARDAVPRMRLAFLFLTAIVGFLVALGPAGLLGGWLAPYAWLSTCVPGFASLRCPVRFAVVVSFALSMLAAHAAAYAERGLARRGSSALRVAVAGLAVALCASWLVTAPPKLTAYRAPTRADLSPAHRWLARHGEGRPLLELPIDPLLHIEDARSMFVSTYHGLPLLNGYTGYTPPGSAFLLAHAQQLPSPGSLQLLVDCAGLEWILVHRATGIRREAWRELPGVRLVREFPPDPERRERDELYRVTLEPSGACPGLDDRTRTATSTPVTTVAAPRGRLAVRVPGPLPPNREHALTISLRNDGATPWPATSIDPETRFMVWYSWQPLDGGTATPWRRVLLPSDLGPGEEIELPVWIGAPAPEGRYLLRLRAGQGDEPAAPLLAETPVELRRPRS